MDPQEIEQVSFTTSRLRQGYDPDEVDAFLDRVAEEFRTVQGALAKAQDENASLRRRNERLANAPTGQYPPVPAQPPAAPAGVKPSQHAVALLEAAQTTADQVVNEATKRALGVQYEAEKSAQKTVADASAMREAIALEVLALRDKHEQLRQFLKEHLEVGLEALAPKEGTGQ